MLRVGSKGPQVVEWQMFLKEHGFFKAGVAPIFGPKTHAATVDFQKTQSLSADGIVGPATRNAAELMNRPVESLSLDEVARRAGIPVSVLKAVRYVESRGKASAVRFEPHLFHRKRPDLADRVPYTRHARGYSMVGKETNKAALEHAMTVDAATAIRSTSFGSYQVLGAYLLEAYADQSPESAYEQFKLNPGEASDLMVAAWFQDNPIARKAANKKPEPDMRRLARTYNGPNYRVHKYDERLLAAWKANQ